MNRKWLRRVGYAFAIILALVVLYLLVDRLLAKSALRQFEEQLDTNDPGWRYEQLLVKYNARIPPASENATELAIQIKNTLPREWAAWESRPNSDWLPKAARNQLPQPMALAEARRTCTACRAELDLARGIKPNMLGGQAIPLGPNPTAVINPPQGIREALKLLSLDATVAAADRDPPRAIANLIASARFACAHRDEPSLISLLSQLAFHSIAGSNLELILAYCEPSDADLRAFENAWNDIPILTIIQVGMRSERAIGHQMFEFIKATGFGSTGLMILAKVALGYFDREQLYTLKLATQIVDIQKRPPHEWKAKLDQFWTPQAVAGRPLVRLVLPAYEKCIEASLRELTRHCVTQVAIAAERFRLAKGRWPTSVDELTLVGDTRDPYTGQPLRIAKTETGIIVYSCGPDGVDDGGRLDENNATKPNHDFGFRLYSPQFRRLPAKPEEPEQ